MKLVSHEPCSLCMLQRQVDHPAEQLGLSTGAAPPASPGVSTASAAHQGWVPSEAAAQLQRQQAHSAATPLCRHVISGGGRTRRGIASSALTAFSCCDGREAGKSAPAAAAAWAAQPQWRPEG